MKIKTLPLGFLAANCYIVWSDRTAAVIDPGAHPERILSALDAEGLTCSAILLTHGHHDHMLAAPELQRQTGAPITLHSADGACFTDARVASFRGYPSHYRPPEAVVAAKEGFSLSLDALTLTCMHTPGHSAGSVIWCVAERSEASPVRPVWFSGDTLFRFEIGRVDLYRGSAAAMRETLIRINAESGDADVYPGHGEPTTLAEERRGNPYLLGTERLL